MKLPLRHSLPPPELVMLFFLLRWHGRAPDASRSRHANSASPLMLVVLHATVKPPFCIPSPEENARLRANTSMRRLVPSCAWISPFIPRPKWVDAYDLPRSEWEPPISAAPAEALVSFVFLPFDKFLEAFSEARTLMCPSAGFVWETLYSSRSCCGLGFSVSEPATM